MNTQKSFSLEITEYNLFNDAFVMVLSHNDKRETIELEATAFRALADCMPESIFSAAMSWFDMQDDDDPTCMVGLTITHQMQITLH